MKTRPDLSTTLRSLGARAGPGEAVPWAEQYGSAWSTALAACDRREWLTWLAGALMRRGHLDRRVLVRCACACARTALQYVPAGEERPLRAIEVTEAWCRGEATIDEVREARRGAYATATAATYAAATYAAAAAGAVTYAAAATANAATYAATYAAAAYANAERSRVWREARAKAEAEMLAITRRELGPALLEALDAYVAARAATAAEVQP